MENFNKFDLFEFAKNNYMNDSQLAIFLGVSGAMISKYRKGILPNIKNIKMFINKSNNLISAEKIFKYAIKHNKINRIYYE